MRSFEVRLENKEKTQTKVLNVYRASLLWKSLKFSSDKDPGILVLLGLSPPTTAEHTDPNTRGGASSGHLGVSQPGRLVSRSAAPSSLYDDSAINLEELFRAGPELWDSSLFHA